MGWHTCQWCEKQGDVKAAHIYRPYSSQDVTLEFDSGRTWRFPHTGLLHYVTSHHYLPPEQFVMDVLTAKVVSGKGRQTKALETVVDVGYLLWPDMPTGHVPDAFVDALRELIWQARDTMRVQTTRGIE